MNDMAATSLMEGTGIGFLVLKSMGMLCLVLGILIGILFLLKRLSQSRAGYKDKPMIRQISTFYMAPKEKVVLLDVMGKKILIGVTPQTITHIADMDHIEDENEQPLPSMETSLFKNLLTRLSADSSQKGDEEPSILHKAGVSS